ncbi:GGDEF domain-containing protein [Hydrogenimonas urashimensis]|uniref:GGDEF domain-containing protein n=1 Tax=Hydrogenimonas urashimensis TaxID=2740515 RepID=UPI001916A9E6|nr:GGDEF domain-containing protein [Hydrogenimonas urashimensis]
MNHAVISLKSLNIAIAALLLLFVAMTGYEEYRNIDNEFTTQLKRAVESKTFTLQEHFTNDFDRIHYVFNKTSDLDRKKLMEAKAYFDRIDKPIGPIKEALNRHVVFGTYEVFLIDRNRVIVNASFKPDIGLDFKKFDIAMKVFDIVESGEMPYHASHPYLHSITQEFVRYFLTLSTSKKFFVQISHSYFPIDSIKKEVETLKSRHRDLRSLDVILFSNGLIKTLNGKMADKRQFFERLAREKRSFINRFIQDIGGIDPKSVNEKSDVLTQLFNGRKLRYRIDDNRQEAVVYSVSENLFNEPLNKEYILLRSRLDLHPQFAHYHQRLLRLGFQIFAALSMVLIMLFLFRKFFSESLERISTAIVKEEDVDSRGFVIDELVQVAEALNGYRSRVARKHQELEALSFSDALTGAYNRRYFAKMLEQALYEFKRYKKRYALIVFDIDDFKTINDRYGHDTGDRVLQELTRIIEEDSRRTDRLFRIGGEEFAMLIQTDGVEGAVRFAEALCRKVAGRGFAEGLHITLSVRVTLFKEGDDAISVFKRADEYAYHSKRQGKNRITGDSTKEAGICGTKTAKCPPWREREALMPLRTPSSGTRDRCHAG